MFTFSISLFSLVLNWSR